MEEANNQQPCAHCGHSPCMLDDGLYDMLVEYDAYLRETDTKVTTKQICYQLYREATKWIHGHLGSGVRRELPVCMRGEILDLTAENDGKYVGFKEKHHD